MTAAEPEIVRVPLGHGLVAELHLKPEPAPRDAAAGDEPPPWEPLPEAGAPCPF